MRKRTIPRPSWLGSSKLFRARQQRESCRGGRGPTSTRLSRRWKYNRTLTTSRRTPSSSSLPCEWHPEVGAPRKHRCNRSEIERTLLDYLDRTGGANGSASPDIRHWLLDDSRACRSKRASGAASSKRNHRFSSSEKAMREMSDRTMPGAFAMMIDGDASH